MKKYLVKILGVSFLSLFLFSCEMDLLPPGQIPYEGALETIDDAHNFAYGMASYFRALHYGIFSYTHEVQGDMFNATVGFGNRNGAPHRMDGSFTSGDYSLQEIYGESYLAIQNFNFFINNIDNVEVEKAADQKVIDAYKGWAYFYRAFVYHDLVRRFAGNYNSANASNEGSGIPIVTEPDLYYRPVRSSIVDVYDFILDDIEKAETFLAATNGKVRAETPTKDALKALKARVYFYQGDYAQSAVLAQEIIEGGLYNLANDSLSMVNEFLNDNGPESIMQLYADITEGGIRANSIFAPYDISKKVFNPDFVPTQTCLDMYESDDFRYKQWFVEGKVSFSTYAGNMMLFTKYLGNPALLATDATSYNSLQAIKVFTLPQMYLIAVESLLSQDTPDPAKALQLLNELQTARNATPSSAATMEEVQKEWAKETIGEGVRIDALRRWNQGFSGRIPQISNVVVSGNSYVNIEVEASEPMLAIPC